MIGAKRAMAFDLTAACSGFVVGLITAAQFIRTGQYRNIVIIGADALSRYVDWRDRGKTTSFTSLQCPVMLKFGARAHLNMGFGLQKVMNCHRAGTCILFGDGCGAVVMTAQEGSCSLLGSSMCSDGLGQKHLKVSCLQVLTLLELYTTWRARQAYMFICLLCFSCLS